MQKLLLFFTLLAAQQLFAQTAYDEYYTEDRLRYEDYIYQEGIFSIKFHPNDDNLAMPAIPLYGSKTLLLSFDDLYEDYVNYSYTIVHCNADWTPSNLLPQEYLSNFTDYYLEEYEYSLNALVPYTHYNLQIPNSNTRFTKSGNYLLIIYRDDDKNNRVLTRRFFVYEDVASVGAQVKRATQVEKMNTHQEIDFTINHTNYTIQNPFQDLQVHIYQNQRWDNVLTTLKPQFVQNQSLVYNYDDINTFSGGNEFRFFDIKNLQVLTQNVARTTRDSLWYVYLKAQAPKPISKYAVFFDINGQFVVRRLDADNSDTEADYAYVDFYLDAPMPYADGDVYIFGKITDWKLLPQFKLQYDYNRKAYKGQILLKQGYYNYMFATLKDGNSKINTRIFEGEHWETENTYQFFIYNREVGQRYDRLIGYSTATSEDLY